MGVGVGAPDAEKMSASCWMASMVWAQKRAKVAAGAELERASALRLAVSVAASAEDIAGMALLWVENCTFLDVYSSRVSEM